MNKVTRTCIVNKKVLEESITLVIEDVFYDKLPEIFSRIMRNMSNEKYFKKYILDSLNDYQDWSSIQKLHDTYQGAAQKVYSLEMFGFLLALSRWMSKFSWAYHILENQDEAADLDDSFAEEVPPITKSSSFMTANKSKLVITPKITEKEMDISFTEEDQSATGLLITNDDQPKIDSFTKKDKKKRKKKKSRKNQSQEANQVTQPILSSSSSIPPVLEKSSPLPSSTQEKGKSLGRKDKQPDMYGEDEANYIVTGFQPSLTSKVVRGIVVYDIPAK
ncbi:hypothetical protein RclHR1_25400001 [Rhizophagus clarus]|uniref:Uncharacterized protein n=1 Tax=Rhizophagus clarus TaxID=94130 RepID=A0A2Z6R0M2_9GLOM|nr:hypothetical protein RclHR1_25400001 [Rhizophagus clarus]GES94187.1 hypothetical protein RCL_jg27631.t1 [Rhizophagus clarus]